VAKNEKILMFISVANLYDRYVFLVGHNKGDPEETYLRSLYDFDLVHGVESTYPTFAEAHAAAARVVHFIPSAVLAKKASVLKRAQEDKVESTLAPEDRVVDHFSEQYRLMDRRLRQIKTEEPDDREDLLHRFLTEIDAFKQGMQAILDEIETGPNIEELKGIIDDVKSLKDEAESLQKRDSAKRSASGRKINIDPLPFLLPLAEVAAKALVPIHETVRVERIEEDPSSGYYIASLEDDDGQVCDLHFTRKMLMCSVCPSGRTASICPYHSRKFMETYWEPIVTAVGHFMLPGKNILISYNHPGSTRSRLMALNLDSGSECTVGLTADDNTWWLKEEKIQKIASGANLVGKEIRCTKKELPGYYGRTGTVKNQEDKGDYTEYSVDFRRGLGILVLTDKDIEPA